MGSRYRAAIASAVLAQAVSAASAEVILQYFEARWDTIENRMPDIFMAGYAGLWVPPPGRADTGDFSVGYDVYDRFDLGDGSDPTLYGTRQSLTAMLRHARRADIYSYVDLVINHNGFRDHNTPGFETGGGYPGFAVSLPGDPYGDFHQPPGTDRYTERVAGLIDIAQEKNHVYIRHPIAADPANLPFKPIDPQNAALYPDRDLPANSVGVHPFNLADPLAGDPTLENATGVLLRYTQWLVDVVGFDGFRVDAQKHVPEWYFNAFHDNVVYQRGLPDAAGQPTTPFAFGEVFDGSYSVLAGYIRKDGFGNRDVLDYAQYFAIASELNANGFGNWSTVLNTSVDFTDGNGFDGSRGVFFVNNHDVTLPTDNLLGYVYILTRPSYPIVYYNAGEFGSRPFPNASRTDPLGGPAGALITTLVDIHNEYGRGPLLQRWLDGDVVVLERQNVMLVGLNDNGDTSVTTYDQRNVITSFAPGTRLYELTGNAADPVIDAGNNIASVLVVGGDQRVNIRVPRNINRRGYVIYAPINPDGALTISPTAGVIPADPPSVPAVRRRLTPVPVVTSATFNVQLQTVDADALDVGGEDDNALFKIDRGGDFNNNGGIDHTTGFAAGFEDFLTQKSPLFGGGTGTYVQTVDTSDLSEGYHYLQAIAFRHRTSGEAIFETFRQPFYVDRQGPGVELVVPDLAPDVDVTTPSLVVRVARTDDTANRVHILFDRAANADVLPLVNTGNQALRFDTDEFIFPWNGITSGNHTITVVAFEPSGNHSVTRYAGVRAIVNGRPAPGDVNNDGSIDFFDIDPFVAQLFSGVFTPQGDMNGDGLVDFFDIDGFLEALF